MKRSELQSMFGTERPILGMIHLPPLPGSPNYGGSMTAVIDHALQDAETLVSNGISAMIVENLGDYPYYPETTEPETVAAMTRVALEVRKRYDLPLGINILRNSWKAAMAVAARASAVRRERNRTLPALPAKCVIRVRSFRQSFVLRGRDPVYSLPASARSSHTVAMSMAFRMAYLI